MSDSDQAVLAHDFEVLLRYVAEQKVMLTPKQQFIPVRHVRNMMADFRIKEPHEEKIGDRIYKKREEREYPRFYPPTQKTPCMHGDECTYVFCFGAMSPTRRKRRTDLAEAQRAKAGFKGTAPACRNALRRAGAGMPAGLHFLDLLALSGEFLKITGQGRLTKGPNWQKFFEAPAAGRPFYLFCTFRAEFNVEAWFLRGGGFGERLEEKWSNVWSYLAEWREGQSINWEAWAAKVVEECGLFWGAPDQTYAKDHMIWGLKYCLIEPMNYFGILELEYREGKYSPELETVKLNPTGIDYFKRLDFGPKVLRSVSSWFSVN